MPEQMKSEQMKKVSPLRGEGRRGRTEEGRIVTEHDANIDSLNNDNRRVRPKIGGLSIYRMQLLGTEGMHRYYETGYIPDELID